jgi:transcriptional regulator GlxA family with amidase domain
MRIAIHVFPDAEELDWVGPYEVLQTWALRDETVEVVLVADELEPVRCAKGLRVLPDTTWDRLGPIDVLVWPGGRGTREQLGQPAISARLRAFHDDRTLLVSVCTGALVLADAGLLDGRPATTYWSVLEQLATLGTDIEVRGEDRFVDDGDIITASGVSAGIDVSLHLVARLASVELAREVRRAIQYDPQPPV